MKNVMLIGDSIRYGAGEVSPGYGVFVKTMLEGRANVWAPDDNCRFAQYTLRYFHEWLSLSGMERVDVIHWNNGLWDVLRLCGDEPLTPVDVYVDNMKRVLNRMRKLCPDAKIIFATSTPVIEAWARPDFFRYNSDIEKYNEAIVRELTSLGVEINDLYSVAAEFRDSMHSDWVHYGDEGSKELAKVVVSKLEKYL